MELLWAGITFTKVQLKQIGKLQKQPLKMQVVG
jgi:hypothetical protein